MVATLRSALENVEQMTASGGSLQATLGNVRALSERAAGRYGVLGVVLGSDEEAQKLVATVDRANSLLTSVNSLVGRTDTLVLKTEERLFAQGGVLDGTTRAVDQLNSLLTDVRESLKRADGILADAEATAGNAKAATADLGALRTEVDASVRKISSLIDEINRKWPFERKTEIRLP